MPMRRRGMWFAMPATLVVAVALLAACKSQAYAPSLAATSDTRTSVEATEVTLPAPNRTSPSLRTDPRGAFFDADAAIREATAIAAFGVRASGSPREFAAAQHIAERLRAMGLKPRLQRFPLPDGHQGVNVIVTVDGTHSRRAVLLGSHIDSKPPSPGANDNASGCGVLLAIAAQIAQNKPPVSVDLVFWGSEELAFGGGNHHHLGSRYHARSLTARQRRRYVGMASVDMVGVGTDFHVRTMGRGPRTLVDAMLAEAKKDGVALSYLRDPGRTGWSDHEAYELLGMPVALVEWEDDPRYHTKQDVPAKLESRPVRVTGEFLTRFLYRIDDARISLLDRR